jgi:hypothetical protein
MFSKYPQKVLLLCASWVGSGAIIVLSSVPKSVVAQARCDASAALGHIKRLEGPRGGVVIVRAGGGGPRVTDPPSLTPVCALDDIRTSGAAIAFVEVYGAAPVTVRSFSPWTPLRPRGSANMRQNVWAMVTDKFMPDLGRVETVHGVRGGPLEPSVARVPGVRNGTDVLPIDELAGVIRLPISGELWLSQAQLKGTDGRLRASRAIEGQDIVFDAAELAPGRYEVIATKNPIGRLPPPTRTLGTITLVSGRGPSIETQGRNPYTPEMVNGLRALWLADTQGTQFGLLAYQLAKRAKMEEVPTSRIAELVLKTLSTAGSSAPPLPAPAGSMPPQSPNN